MHFYNRNARFARILQEVGCATVKNFVLACDQWFDTSLEEYDFYLMPIAFVTPQEPLEAISLNPSEANVAGYIGYLDKNVDKSGDFSMTVALSVRFERSSEADALKVKLSNEPEAIPIKFSDDQIRKRFPYVYDTLTAACRKRYEDFKADKKYHDLRKGVKSDAKYCHMRYLDPDRPKSAKQEWFSEAIFTILDKHYTRRPPKNNLVLPALTLEAAGGPA